MSDYGPGTDTSEELLEEEVKRLEEERLDTGRQLGTTRTNTQREVVMGQLSESLARIGRELWDLQGSVPPEEGYEVLRERLNELALAVVVLSRETRGGVLVGGRRMSQELVARIAGGHARVGKKPGRPMKKRPTGGSGNLKSGRRPGG